MTSRSGSKRLPAAVRIGLPVARTAVRHGLLGYLASRTARRVVPRTPRGWLSLAWTLAAVVQFLAGLNALRRSNRTLPVVRPGKRHDLASSLTAGGLSVVIPARDEAATISACLSSAAAAATTSSPVERIVVVDDRSSDGTSEAVIRWATQRGLDSAGDEGGVRRWRLHRRCVIELIQGAPLPNGWYGKPHALAQGAARCTDTRWILFLDADTRLRTSAYGALVGAAEAYGLDLLSVLTRQELETWWEKVFQPAVFGSIVFAFPVDAVNDPSQQDMAIANGQCLLVRNETYQRLGGHAAIRSTIAEDQQLALLVKRNGGRIMIGDGRDIGTTRMYERPQAFWEGWTKNIYQGSGGSFALILLGAQYFLVSQAMPPVFAVASAALGNRTAAAFWAGTWVTALGLRRSFDRQLGVPLPWTLTQPLGALGLVALMLGSGWRALRGTTTWRGRTYDVRADPLPAGSPSLLRRLFLALRP